MPTDAIGIGTEILAYKSQHKAMRYDQPVASLERMFYTLCVWRDGIVGLGRKSFYRVD